MEYRSKATKLQESVIDHEEKQLSRGIDYTEQHVRLATVHTRQDLVLVVSHLKELVGVAKWIRLLLVVVVVLLMFLLGKP